MYKNGNKAMVVMSLISIATSLIVFKIDIIKENLHKNYFLWSVITFAIYAIIAKLTYGFNSNEFRALLCASLVLLTFPAELLTRKKIIVLTLLASICTLFYSIYNHIYLGLERSALQINAVPYSTICAGIAICSFSLFLTSKNYKEKLFNIIPLLLLSSSIIILETRGVWLSFSLTIFILLLLNLVKISLKKKLISLIFLIIITIPFSFIFKTDIEQRIQQTSIEINKIESGDLNTSIGLRLQMWALAPEMIKGDELLGTGENQVMKFNSLYKEGYISKSLYNFHPSHYHNQYIDNTIKGGFIGLLLLLILLSTPLLYIKKRNQFKKNIIIGIIVLYAISSLTDVPFIHGQTMLFYTLILCGLRNIDE
ncbi:O-antigen ligase family protein [Photobacterium leiognathi]|uniref:O-antigen ligase family protein n=1 Tax=Photobacterium leiognathi TaxID=553611 RepID=UPI0015E6C2FC|nr:O-antigen ligase family protein [Photobacterium leiognathi]